MKLPTSSAGDGLTILPTVTPLDRVWLETAARAIDGKAKPVGALGRLETLACQLAMISGSLKPGADDARLIVFAGDHGLTAEGVTAYPSVVSGLIAQLVLDGGAGANIGARQSCVSVSVCDTGLLLPLKPDSRLIERRIAPGTRNSLREPAMTIAQRDAALANGVAIAEAEINAGCQLLIFGEIGIGNSSAAALLGHAVTGIPLAKLVGNGAGAPPGGLEHKRMVLEAAFARAPTRDASQALTEFAGFEMVTITGAMIAAAARNTPVVVDGFIATACACAAVAIAPDVRDRLIFAHTSAEAGHKALLDNLAAEPLLDLGMRLGEGSGAVLAAPLVRTAAAILTRMADLADVLAAAGPPP